MQTKLMSSLPARLSHGFTLMEMMVVIMIMGIMAGMVVPKLMKNADDARETAARTNIASLVQALKMYKLENGRYPTTEQGLKSLVQKPTSGPIPSNWKEGGYVEKLPKDPWKRDYLYMAPGRNGEVDVFSLGADGEPEGEGINADIGSWQQ